jgi:hypothetical protein
LIILGTDARELILWIYAAIGTDDSYRRGQERRDHTQDKDPEFMTEMMVRTEKENYTQDTPSFHNRSQSVHGKRDHNQNRGSLQKR